MRIQNRNILLLMDKLPKSPWHPNLLTKKTQLQNYKPLDGGIIQMAKTHYRKLMMREIQLAMEECDTVTDIAKKVTVLDAIVNLCLAWNRVQSDSIKKCFYNCGFPNWDDVAEAENSTWRLHWVVSRHTGSSLARIC